MLPPLSTAGSPAFGVTLDLLLPAMLDLSWIQSVPALLQQRRTDPGPESPFGNLLGWIIVFVVIVWPILRGIIEAATGRRREFEERVKAKLEEQRGGDTASKPRKGFFEQFEDDVWSQVQELDADDMGAPEQRAPAARATSTAKGPRERRDELRRLREERRRKSREAAARAERENAARQAKAPRASAHRDLVGDPFDDSLMGRDLVPDEELNDVPSEDEMERLGDEASAPRPTQVGESSSRGPTSSPISAAPQAVAAAPRETPGAAFLEDIERRLTPWQRAFVLKEVLGPPASRRGDESRHF